MRRDIAAFVKNVVKQYVGVKTTDHYSELHKIIERDVESTCSSGRLFYLAVPPSAYATIANAINTLANCPRKFGFAPCSRNRSEVITTRH